MSSGCRIRVMVVDDHPVMRNGLRDALEASGRFEVVGEAGDGAEAVRTVAELNPPVIVMDVIMPGKDGIDACREIMELLPDTRVMMLTASTEEDAVIEAIAAGATGYLQKYSRPEALVEAVIDVAEGQLRIPDQAVKRVFAMIRGERKPVSRRPSDQLTSLERETLTLFASGRSYAEIAKARGNSVVTIRNTLYRIQNKLGIQTKQELVIWAVRNGLLDDVAVGIDAHQRRSSDEPHPRTPGPGTAQPAAPVRCERAAVRTQCHPQWYNHSRYPARASVRGKCEEVPDAARYVR